MKRPASEVQIPVYPVLFYFQMQAVRLPCGLEGNKSGCI